MVSHCQRAWFSLIPSAGSRRSGLLLCCLLLLQGRSAGAGVYEILGTKYYVSTLAVALYKNLYVPVILVLAGILYWLILRHQRRWLKWSGLVVLLVAGIGAPSWDIYRIGQQAKRLCTEQAGLHVYKAAETDGFLGTSSIEYWSDYGFSYVETGGTKGRKFRVTLRDGEPHYERIPDYQSRYQSRGGMQDQVSRHFVRLRYVVEDRQTDELLGELITFTIYPGWLDSLVVGALGFSWSPWICGDEPALGVTKYGKQLLSDDVIKATLKPKTKIGRDIQ